MARLSPAGLFEEARRRRVFRIATLYIVAAFVAIQAADLIFPGLGIPESSIIYVWIGSAIGLPFALFFGWRFDLIGGRILLTAAPDEAALPIGRTDKITLSAMSMLLLAMIVGICLEIAKTRGEGTTTIQTAEVLPNSVAVLPFANFGGADENEFIADGITDTLLHALAQLPNLHVTARTSSFYYKGKDRDIREIAAQLGVSKILEGSVQFSGNRIRVVAQLIEAETGFHLWSETYDEDMDEIFEVQDSIASNVAVEMHVTLAPYHPGAKIDSVSTSNLDAYLKYLEGLEQFRIGSNISYPQAERLFIQALEQDPEFAEARRELVACYYDMAGNGTISREEAAARMGPALRRLQDDDPEDGFAIGVAGGMAEAMGEPGIIDIDDLIRKLVTAIARKPNDVRVYRHLVNAYRDAGRREEAVDTLNRALAIDPLDFRLHYSDGRILFDSGDYEAATKALEQVVFINPKWPSGHSFLGDAKMRLGDYAGWYRHLTEAWRLDPLDPEMASALTHGLRVIGLSDESDFYLQRAREVGSDNGRVMDEYLAQEYMGDSVESRSITESYLRDGPYQRGSGFSDAAYIYASVSLGAGETQAALVFFEEILPGVTAKGFVPATRDEFFIHYWATILWAQDKSIEQIDLRLESTEPEWNRLFPVWNNFHTYVIPIAILRGDMAELSRMAARIEDNNPFVLFMYRHMYPHKNVASEPAIAERLAVIEENISIGREAIQAYIQENKKQPKR
jgi:TolB-like protein/Flp pilus assembly protein TadD